MALTLSDAITQVRYLTRHDVDTRVTDAQITQFLNSAYKQVRTRLAVEVPSLYLITSSSLALADGDIISLTGSGIIFENIFRVERRDEQSNWRPVQRSNDEDPNYSLHGKISFRLEGDYMMFAPDWSDTSGVYRVLYHKSPTALVHPTDAAVAFEVPAPLEQALVYMACGLVAMRDAPNGPEEKKNWDGQYEDEWKRASPALRRRHGLHRVQSGLVRIMGH